MVMVLNLLKPFQPCCIAAETEKKVMKKTIVAIAGFLVIACNVVLADTAADQKWLTEVQKMVTQGQTKVSTSNEDRVKLVEGWAKQHSYSVTVTKTDGSYKLDITRNVVKN
jgi:hypothetical protein